METVSLSEIVQEYRFSLDRESKKVLNSSLKETGGQKLDSFLSKEDENREKAVIQTLNV